MIVLLEGGANDTDLEKSGQDLPPAVPSATCWVPEQPNEVVSEGPSGKP